MGAVIFLYLPLGVLCVLCALCLAKLGGSRRRGLLPAVLVMIFCAVVLFVGEWLLKRNGLTWRNVPKLTLCSILWLTGLSSGVLTVRYVTRWLNGVQPKLALWGTALTLYCLICVMGAGTLLGGLWSVGPSEQVGTWQEQTVVQGKWSWMETTYDVYEYHGPLVRGTESLGWSEMPMLEESAP